MQVNDSLIIAGSFGQILLIRGLDFHIVDCPGIVLYIHVQSDTFGAVTLVDGFLQFRVGDLPYLYAQNHFQQRLTVFGISHDGPKDEIIHNG